MATHKQLFMLKFQENILQTSEEIDSSKTSKDVSTTPTPTNTQQQPQQKSRSGRSISEMSTPQVSKRTTTTKTIMSETPPASKKSSTSNNNTPSTKRSNAKLSTGSMMAGSFSHSLSIPLINIAWHLKIENVL